MNNIHIKIFGLIGKSLSHSFSRQFFTNIFAHNQVDNAEYRLFPLEKIDDIVDLLKYPSLHGFNVTIPYKTQIISYLDGLDSVAEEIGSVNCVVRQNNKWIGYNTDIIGFEVMFREVKDSKGSALVLGSGGASKSVCYFLKQRDIPFQIVSRNKTDKTITYIEVSSELIHNSTFIINTTPLGMHPNIGEIPQIPFTAFHHNNILIDLIYNPEETLFLQEGKKRGALTMNGLQMFYAQAEATLQLFNI